MKKPRSNSKLDFLDLEQQQQLCEWMLSGLPYGKIKSLLLDQFKVSTSRDALGNFYQSYVAPYILERRRLAVGVVHEIGDDIKRLPGQFNKVTIDALEQKAFELAQNPTADPAAVKSIFALVMQFYDQALKERDIEIKLRRLEALEAKEARTEQAKSQLKELTSKGGLTKETLEIIERAAKLL